MHGYSFEKLECWLHAKDLAIWIYKITANFPGGEKYGIINQMRRAAVSIAANLAEGTSRSTKKDQAHFSTISYSSTIELLNHLIISKELDFMSDKSYEEGRAKIERQTYLIAMLRKSQRELFMPSQTSKLSKPF